MKALFTILLFLIMPVSFVLAQNSYFRGYSVEHGLPFVQVQTIFQDSKGYLWSGGYGGLSRFDGNSFMNFSSRNGLVSHSVTAINEDHNRNLWIGTTNGLSCFNGKTFKNFKTEDGLPDNFITYLVEDSGMLWIGTMNGIAMYDGKSFKVFNTETGLPTNRAYCVYKDRKGRYLLGTDNGLLIYDGKIRTVNFEKEIEESGIYSITENKEGQIYCGTGKGLFLIDEVNGLKKRVDDPGLNNSRINALVNDRRGMIWAATSTGLYRITKNIIRRYSVATDVNSNTVISLRLDYEGNLWVGTYNGMYRYRDDQFTTYNSSHGLKNEFVFQMSRDIKNDLWVATTEGLNIFNGRSFRHLSEKDGLPSSSVLSCVQGPDGKMWVGTAKGLAVFDTKVKQYTKKNGLVSDSVCTMTLDSRGRMLIGGAGGITIYENGKFTAHTFKSPYSSDFSVWKILEQKNGDFIIATYEGGVFLYDGKQFLSMNKSFGIKENVVLDVVKDKDEILYFATFDGVFMYIPETYPNKKVQRLVRFNENSGMSSDLAYCLSFDQSERYLWVGTNQGLNRIDISSFKKRGGKKVEVFGKEDGFMGVESNTNGIYLDHDGSMWFGTVSGLIHYNPYEYIPNIFEPKVNLTNIRLFYNDTTFVKDLVLPYDANHLSFNFSATSLTNPAKVKYRYMLEGFDESWSPASHANLATYSNLPPGKYTFKVLAANNEGIWSQKASAFSFSIKRPWWNTWLFRGIVTTIVAAAVVLGFRIRTQQIRRNERRVARQNLEIAKLELKALRAQMNPHFIFNSLNSIQHFIMQREETSAVKYLNKFAKLIRIILNNSEKPAITLREEIEALELYLQLEELRFSEKFEYVINVDPDIDIDYYEVPPLILQPYVENAILHGLNPKPHKGLLEVSIKKEGTFIICTVRDNGIGRRQAMKMKGEVIRKHISHGTRITRERLEILNRSFHSELSVNITDLELAPGGETGTRVDVYIPA